MKKILLIEPDRQLADIYLDAIKRHGYAASRASGAQSAVTQTDLELPDAIVLELALATHNGIEFLYELRSYPEWQNIPIIILSQVPPPPNFTMQMNKQRLNIVKYLYKPATSLKILLENIAQVA